ncbi:hypothetical protein Vafri_8083, partial [Volvox africanus]
AADSASNGNRPMFMSRSTSAAAAADAASLATDLHDLARACLALQKASQPQVQPEQRQQQAASPPAQGTRMEVLGAKLQDALGSLLVKHHRLQTQQQLEQQHQWHERRFRSPLPPLATAAGTQELQLPPPPPPLLPTGALLDLLLHPRNMHPPLSLRQAVTWRLAPGGDGGVAWRLVKPHQYDTVLQRLMAQPVQWTWPLPPWPASAKLANTLPVAEEERSPPPALPEGLAPLVGGLERVISDAEEGLRYGGGGGSRWRVRSSHTPEEGAAVAAEGLCNEMDWGGEAPLSTSGPGSWIQSRPGDPDPWEGTTAMPEVSRVGDTELAGHFFRVCTEGAVSGTEGAVTTGPGRRLPLADDGDAHLPIPA